MNAANVAMRQAAFRADENFPERPVISGHPIVLTRHPRESGDPAKEKAN
jgi:hypothetical protein